MDAAQPRARRSRGSNEFSAYNLTELFREAQSSYRLRHPGRTSFVFVLEGRGWCWRRTAGAQLFDAWNVAPDFRPGFQADAHRFVNRSGRPT